MAKKGMQAARRQRRDGEEPETHADVPETDVTEAVAAAAGDVEGTDSDSPLHGPEGESGPAGVEDTPASQEPVIPDVTDEPLAPTTLPGDVAKAMQQQDPAKAPAADPLSPTGFGLGEASKPPRAVTTHGAIHGIGNPGPEKPTPMTANAIDGLALARAKQEPDGSQRVAAPAAAIEPGVVIEPEQPAAPSTRRDRLLARAARRSNMRSSG